MAKAISPMIALILSIAFVIAVGAILAVWGPGLIGTITKPVGPEARRVIEWSFEAPKIDGIKGNEVYIASMFKAPPNYTVERFYVDWNEKEILNRTYGDFVKLQLNETIPPGKHVFSFLTSTGKLWKEEFEVKLGDFSISLAPSSGSVVQGKSTETNLTATLTKMGSLPAVVFSCLNLPSGVSCSFSPASCIPSCEGSLTLSTSATTPTGSYNITINATSAGITRIANYSLTVMLGDTQPPTYSLNSTNTTIAGEAVEHRLRWNDNIGLSGYIFSFDNCTGSFVNDTWVSMTGTENWSNVTKVVNSTVGCMIRWRVFANDSYNNWNASETFSYSTIGWLGGFSYRRPITINNTANTNTLADYQVLVTLDTASLISQGKMRSDCGDIRFTDSDETTLLNYWLESGCNTTSTKLWVKVPSIPASSTKTIYVYYGNPVATSASNGSTTFDYFQTFDELATGSLSGQDGWTGDTIHQISTELPKSGAKGVVYPTAASGAHYVERTVPQLKASVTEIWVRARSGYAGNAHYFLLLEDSSAITGIRVSSTSQYNAQWPVILISGGWSNTNWGWIQDEWRKFKIITRADNTIDVYYYNVTGALLGSAIRKTPYTLMTNGINKLRFYDESNNYGYFDELIYRKFTDPEPTTSIGAEETI